MLKVTFPVRHDPDIIHNRLTKYSGIGLANVSLQQILSDKRKPRVRLLCKFDFGDSGREQSWIPISIFVIKGC